MSRRANRIKIAAALLATVIVGTGIAAQHRWDAQCAAEQPGSHWNGDLWLCERNGK